MATFSTIGPHKVVEIVEFVFGDLLSVSSQHLRKLTVGNDPRILNSLRIRQYSSSRIGLMFVGLSQHYSFE